MSHSLRVGGVNLRQCILGLPYLDHFDSRVYTGKGLNKLRNTFLSSVILEMILIDNLICISRNNNAGLIRLWYKANSIF